MLLPRCIRAVSTALRLQPSSGRFMSTAVDTQLQVQIKEAAYRQIDSHIVESVLQEEDPFSVSKIVSLKQMFVNRVYMGHKTSTLHPHMRPYIFGSRFDHLIIDLNESYKQMIEALNFIGHIVYRDGIILLVTRNHQTAHMVEKCAQECGEFAHTRNWPIGLFTDAVHSYGTETRLPDCVVLLSTKNSDVAVTECAKMLIPTVAVVDTDCDPRLICYPVAGNDDTPASCSLYCDYIAKVIRTAKKRRKVDLQRSLEESNKSNVE